MSKELSQMSNEELWQLFPIILCEHDPGWEAVYRSERAIVCRAVGEENIVRISHIGSTAVAGLIAKPTIDILLEIKSSCDTQALKEAMKQSGYRFSAQPDNPPPHMMFLKGYTPQGFLGQAFHVHIRYGGDWPELYFRDYLEDHPDVAKRYGELKTGLIKRYRHDRDGYTDAKTAFIKEYSDLAKQAYKDRYQTMG